MSGLLSRSNVVALALNRPANRAAKFLHTKNAERAFTITAHSGSRKTDSRKLLIGAIILSAACHAGMIASAFRDPSDEFGTLADKTDTFSLSMERSNVLESTATESMQTVAAASAAAQAGRVQAVESKPQEQADAESDPLSDESPPKPVKVADVTPTALAKTDDPLPVIRGGGAPDAVSEIKAGQIAEKQVEEMPEAVETKEDASEKAERKKEDKKEKKSPQQESHQQVAGSATSRSNASQAPVSGRASASRGNALSYGAKVRAQLMHNKPASNGPRGTVQVSFGLASDGSIRYLKLSESSGNAILDSVALATVRSSAPFGEPPADLSPTELAYVIPFYFH